MAIEFWHGTNGIGTVACVTCNVDDSFQGVFVVRDTGEVFIANSNLDGGAVMVESTVSPFSTLTDMTGVVIDTATGLLGLVDV